jgi:hypothetical protein
MNPYLNPQILNEFESASEFYKILIDPHLNHIKFNPNKIH